MMMFISSMVAAVFSIDLAEMGIKTDDSTALIGENAAPRLQISKNRGLRSLLSFGEQHVNKVLRKVTTKYKLRFVGYEPEDEDKREGILSKQLNTRRSIDDLRKDDGLEPFNEPWSKMPLHPQAVQIYLQTQGLGGGGEYGEETPEGVEEFECETTEEEVEKVGSGFCETMRRKINHFLWSQLRQVPIIDCGIDAKWINPGLYCTVRFLERTKSGMLRVLVFEDLITE